MGYSNIKFEEEFILTEKGLKLFTCRWFPQHQELKALIFLCHGYAMESSISMKGTGNRLAKAGFGVYGIDYIGHGKSDGLHGYIPDFDQLIDDCSYHFAKVSGSSENKGKKRFLMGESMGGAVLLLLHRKMPGFWDGAVLVAPMCKIADSMKPSPLVIKVLLKLAAYIPTWKIVPGRDVINAAIRDPERKKEARSNPYWYKGRLRLKTAQVILFTSIDVEKRLNEVTLPFIVLHGGDDTVIDPAISKALYDSALSTDKTFKFYPGMWHALTYGELPENINTVFSDIIGWLNDRCAKDYCVLERERKMKDDKVNQGQI